MRHREPQADKKRQRLQVRLIYDQVKLWEEVEYTWHAVGPAEDSHLTELQNGGGRRYPEWLREYFNYKFMLLDIAGG